MRETPVELLKRGYVEGHYDVFEFEAALHLLLRGVTIEAEEHPRVVVWLLTPPVARDPGKARTV